MRPALIGAGGHAQEVKAHMKKFTIPCFVDDNYWSPNKNNIFPLSQFDPIEYEVIIAIGNSIDRANIVEKLPKETKYFTYIHPTAQLLSNNIEIGKGSFIGANCILTTNIKIKDHALLNRAVHIGHDCRIGDYFSAMPGAIISGNVKIKDKVYLGSNSTIKETITITSNVIIGAGGVVVKNINKPGVYTGVPCDKIK